MKVTIEYDHDDLYLAKVAIRAGEVLCALDEVEARLRSALKHGEPSQDREVMQFCLGEVCEVKELLA